MKKRDINADLIRIIACLCVLGIHTNDLSGSRWTRIVWHVLFADGVGIFFVLAGFFLFRKPVLQTIRNIFLKVYLPGIFTLLLIFWLGPWLRGEAGFLQTMLHPSFLWKEFFGSIWIKGTLDPGLMGSHLWYIYAYMDMALTLPLLKPVCTPAVPACYRRYLLLFFLACRVIYDLTFIRSFSYPPALYMQIPTCWILAVTGYEIYSHAERIRGSIPVRIVSACMYLGVQTARCLVVRRILPGNPGFDRFYFYDSVPGIITAVSVVLFILSFTEEQLGAIGKLTLFLGPYTFLIYLVHNPLIRFMSTRGFWKTANRFMGIRGIGIDEMKIWQEAAYLFVSIAGVFLFSLLVSMVIKFCMKYVRLGAGTCLMKLKTARR